MIRPCRMIECSVMPHSKITGARTPQEPCKPRSAYVSAELRHVRAGVHGPAPLHECSRESVLAEDPGDDYADAIIDTSHERRDGSEFRTSSPPLNCPTTKATTTTAAPMSGPATMNRLEHRPGTPRTRHQHRALVLTGSCNRTDLEPAACTPSTGPAAGEGRAGGNPHQARLDRHRRRRRHRLGTKVGRDLTQRNEHALEFTGVRAPQGRRRVGTACPGDPKGGYPGAQATRRTRTKPTTPCFGPEPPALPPDSGTSTRRCRRLLLGPWGAAISDEVARRHRACARRAQRRQARPARQSKRPSSRHGGAGATSGCPRTPRPSTGLSN